MVKRIKNFINKLLRMFGYEISKINETGDLFKIHKYKSYDEYKKIQIKYNKNKIRHTFADENTLTNICKNLLKNKPQKNYNGICHGSRNGFEVKFFREKLNNSKIIGTDISDNISQFKDLIKHDFHEEKKEWISYFDFVYSNSLDQSYDPKKALNVWLNQIKKDGFVFVELTKNHTVQSSGEMDPFGVEITYFPYLLVEWFGNKISIKIIKSVKSNPNIDPKSYMSSVIDNVAFVAEGLTSYVFIIRKSND